MRRMLRCLSIVGLIGVSSASAAAGGDCKQTSLQHLQESSPDGFAIYSSTSQHDFFESWIDCGDPQFDLSTAVHETTHLITAETDAFPLVGGGSVERPHEVSSFYPPAEIADRFAASDYAKIYLRRGKSSSSTDFLYLLDELNAYTHDLNAAVDLKALARSEESVDHRDGLAAMMAFVAVYAETAKDSRPETWSGLQAPNVAHAIATIWERAEWVIASSCGIPNFGDADRSYIREFCSTEAQTALEPILGRAPACPRACLAPSPESEQASDDEVAVSSFLTTSRRKAFRQ